MINGKLLVGWLLTELLTEATHNCQNVESGHGIVRVQQLRFEASTQRSADGVSMKINQIKRRLSNITVEGKIVDKSESRRVRTRYGPRSVADAKGNENGYVA